jgi:hypothetical protein
MTSRRKGHPASSSRTGSYNAAAAIAPRQTRVAPPDIRGPAQSFRMTDQWNVIRRLHGHNDGAIRFAIAPWGGAKKPDNSQRSNGMSPPGKPGPHPKSGGPPAPRSFQPLASAAFTIAASRSRATSSRSSRRRAGARARSARSAAGPPGQCRHGARPRTEGRAVPLSAEEPTCSRPD